MNVELNGQRNSIARIVRQVKYMFCLKGIALISTFVFYYFYMANKYFFWLAENEKILDKIITIFITISAFQCLFIRA